jgi:flagellar biogenesis protein FliO
LDLISLARTFGTLVLVLSLLILAVWGIRRFRLFQGRGFGRSDFEPNVSVVLRVPVDAKHTLVMVRRDFFDHLILIGPNSMLLVEQNILVGHKE